MTSGQGKVIAVFGSSLPPEGTVEYEQARRLGRLLARAGFTVMNGGYYGLMEAVSRGATEEGGKAIGITVSLFDAYSPVGNLWLSEERKVADLYERLRILTEEADGFVVLKGGIGTLNEWAFTWALLATESIPRKPCVLLGEHWPHLLAVLQEEMFITERELSWLTVVRTPEEAVERLLATEGTGSSEERKRSG